MKTLLIGAGEVGCHMSDTLSRLGHQVTMIEASAQVGSRVDEEQDVKVLIGNGSSADMLLEAGIREVDNVLALTSDDRTNLVVCAVSKALNPGVFSVARVHDQVYLEDRFVNYQKLFRTDYLLNPEGLAALQLASGIRNPGRVAVENFARGQVEVQQVTVAENSRYRGKSLLQLRLRCKVGLLSRDGILAIPSAETVLQTGDRLTIYGKPENLMEERQNLDPTQKLATVRVVIFGGTETAVSLTRLLANPRFRIRIIEKDGDLCRDLANRFPSVTVIHGDATHRRVLEEEQIGSADHFIGCTKNDEENIMTCLQAHKLGAKRVQLVTNKGDYERLLGELRETMGVDQVVSPRSATASEMVKYLTKDPVIELCQIDTGSPSGGLKLLEVLVRDGSIAANKTLREIQEERPTGSVFVALLRDFRAVVPGGEDQILPGDRVVVIIHEERVKDLLGLLK